MTTRPLFTKHPLQPQIFFLATSISGWWLGRWLDLDKRVPATSASPASGAWLEGFSCTESSLDDSSKSTNWEKCLEFWYSVRLLRMSPLVTPVTFVVPNYLTDPILHSWWAGVVKKMEMISPMDFGYGVNEAQVEQSDPRSMDSSDCLGWLIPSRSSFLSSLPLSRPLSQKKKRTFTGPFW